MAIKCEVSVMIGDDLRVNGDHGEISPDRCKFPEKL
jgi:hypothetical protein